MLRPNTLQTPANSILSIGKFEPPNQRVRMVSRTKLLERLQAWPELTLTLVISPPGFGKTTSLAQWHHQLESRPEVIAAWLTLDEDDAEPARFIADIILSLHRAGLDIGTLKSVAESELLETPEKPVLSRLMGTIIDSNSRVVLILDDYQRANSEGANKIIDMLLHHCPRNFHVAISSRDLPATHVSTLVARGVVQSIDASDLTFSPSESAELFEGVLSPETHAALYSRSEGWAVASQLARIWMQRHIGSERSLRDFDGHQAEVANYLSEQVLQDLPQHARDILLDASTFDRFCPSLLDYVREQSDSAVLLDELTHLDALIVPVDNKHEWFRFHSLFAEYLRSYRQIHHPARTLDVRLRASEWFLLHGDLLEAVRQSVYADDITRAVGLIERGGGWQLIMSHGVGFVGNLLKLFPPERCRQHTPLLVTRAYLCIKRGDWPEVRRCLDWAHALLERSGEQDNNAYTIVDALSSSYFRDLDNHALMLRMDRFADTLDLDDHVTRATAYAICATCAITLSQFSEAEDYSRKGVNDMQAGACIVGTTYCMFHLGQSFYYRGDWQRAQDIFHESLRLADSNFGKDSMLKAVASGLLSRLAYDRNLLDASEVLVEESLDVIEHQDGWLDIYALTCETAVRLAFARQGREAGLAKLEHVRTHARLRGLSELGQLADAWQFEYQAIDGDTSQLPAANGGAVEFDADGQQLKGWRERHAWIVALTRHALADARYAHALRLADEGIAQCAKQQRRADAALLDALAGLALLGQGRPSLAVERFLHSLEFAASADAVRLFFQTGPAVGALIRATLTDRKALPAASPLRDFLLRVQRELQADQDVGPVQLSPRELEVLRELCKGHSNKSIGRTLGVSENTVKFHLKQVYRKLDVSSRTAALSKASQLSLQLDSGKN